MKKFKYKKLLPIFLIILALVFTIIGIFAFSKKIYKFLPSKQDIEDSAEETQYDLEQIFEAFIDEEIPPESMVPTDTVEISGWIAYWDFSAGINTYKNNLSTMKSLSPTWYYVLPDGNLATKSTARDANLKSLCKQNGTKLIPSISNNNKDELSNILGNESLRQKHVSAIVNEVKNQNYDGIDIDYEHLKSGDRTNFSQFIKQLSEELHKEGKMLTIAILWKDDLAPLIEEYSQSRAAQDWTEIGKYVDEFRIMAYDFTGSGDAAGPIAPIDWIKSILDYAVSKVAMDKIVLGLPQYAYEWSGNNKGAKALTWSDVASITINSASSIESNGIIEDKGEKRLVYKSGGTTKTIWYQDAEITKNRIDVAKSYNVNKFVFWRLGNEDPDSYKF